MLDEMYPPVLAAALRDRGLDVVAVAADADLVGADDASVLAAAAAQDRCLVTENVRDFAALAAQSDHAGILLVNSRRWPRTPSGLPRLVDALAACPKPAAGAIGWLI